MKNPTSRMNLLATLIAVALAPQLVFAATNIWSGASGANLLWDTGGNWTPAGPPGVFNGALFDDLGATNAAGAGAVNSIVSTTRTNQFMFVMNTNGFHNVLVGSGVSLVISNNTSTNSMLVGTETDNGSAKTVTATITGVGGTLTLNNTNAGSTLIVRQASASSGSHNATLDLSGLDNFNATIGRILLASQGNIVRPAGTILLAKTNTLVLNGANPALDLGDGTSNGGLAIMQLGQTNAIFSDNITVGRQKAISGTTLIFNPAFVANNPVAYFRGLNRTNRVSNWLIADNSAQTTANTGCSAAMDLSGGIVDAMVDTFIIGRGENGTGTGASTGTLTLGVGTLDVNTLEVGFQMINTAAAVSSGTVNFNGPGTLNVNTSLRLARYPGGAPTPVGTFNMAGGTVNDFGDVVDGGGNSTLSVNSGILDMQPPGDAVAGNITVKTMNVGSAGTGIITNAATITVSNTLTLSSGAIIAGNTTLNLPSSSSAMDVNGLSGGFTLGSTQKLQGFGTLSGDVTQSTGATLNPGGSAAAGTLTFNNNLNLSANGNLLMDLSNDPSQAGNGVNDLLQVNGNLTLTGTNNVTLTALNGDFSSGSYRLINYNGTMTGDATYFQVTGPAAQSRRLFAFDTNTANQVNLDVTGNPAVTNLIWVGGLAANAWDLQVTSNWNNNGLSDLFYNLDGVIFDDTGSASPAVSLAGTLVPSSILVTNDAKAYTFSGLGAIAGVTGLTKQGANSLTIAGSGAHSFGGPITIGNGTLTIAGTGADTFSGPITIANGTLAYDRNDDLTVANVINGSSTSTLLKQNTNILTVSGVSGSFDGAVVVSSGTLKAGSATALGSTVGSTAVSSGATLDVNHLYLGLEPVTVSGWGVNSNGAIINSGASVFPALTRVTLAGDTAFGGPGVSALGGTPQGRWDIRLTSSGPTDPAAASLSTGGNAYNLFKVGSNYVGLVNVTVDPMLANVDIQGGTLSLQYNTTTIGNPTNALTIRAGAALDFFNSTNLWNKVIAVNGDGVSTNLSTSSGTNVIIGPVTLNGSCVANIAANTYLILAGGVSGTGGLIKNGGSSLILTSPTNTWSGGTLIAGGGLQTGDGIVNGSLPPQPITNNGTLSFSLGGGTFIFTNQISGSGGIFVTNFGTTILTAANTFSNQVLINSTNGAALRINNGNALGDTSGLTHIVGNTFGNGRLELLGGITVADPFLVDCRQANSIDVPLIVNVSDTNTLTGPISGTTGGSDWNFQSDNGKLTIAGNFINTATSATRLIKLMGAGLGEWSGIISNNITNASITSIVKTNSGTWTLSGANEYTGSTTVNGGVLLVNGSIAGGGATVNSGTLGGSGTINGNVAVNAAGTLSPGNSIGTMTIFGNLSLAGTNVMELNKSGVTLTSDKIQGVSHLSFGGVLQLQITGDPLTTTDSFLLYSAGLRDGLFTSIIPTTPGTGLAWNTNTLAADGILRIANGVSTVRTNITMISSGGSLDLTWPQDHTGWRLQAQTNPITVGLHSNWFDVPGSTTTNHMIIPISPTNGSVFFRIIYP